jgi:hypothetical protein
MSGRIAFALLVALSGCVTTSQEGNFKPPHYSGVIKTISSPIIISQRPFSTPKVTGTKKTEMRFTKDEETVFVTETTYFEHGRKASEKGLLITGNFSHKDMTMNEERATMNLNISFSALINKNNEFLNVKMNIPGMDTNDPRLKKAMKQLDGMIKKANDPLNNKPVKTGDIQYGTLNFDLSPDMPNMVVSVNLIVRGISIYEGREVLVMDSKSTISFEGAELTGTGYSLIDIKTGAEFFGDSLMVGELSGDKVQIREISRLNLQ